MLKVARRLGSSCGTHRSSSLFLVQCSLLARRRRSTSSAAAPAAQPEAEAPAPQEEKLVAAVALERLPLIVPEPPPEVVAFQTFQARWNDQYRRVYPKEFVDSLSSSQQREENALELKWEPGPRITEADKNNDRKSLNRALDRRLFFIVQGYPAGKSKEKPIWHFPERVYKNEATMRMCAESVLVPAMAQEDELYFVGNAPCGHFIETLPAPKTKIPTVFKRFFFRCQILSHEYHIRASSYKDYAWVTKEELLEYFELDLSVYMKQMLVDDLRVIY